MRIWTGTTGAPATPTLDKHHRPPTRDAGPRGQAPSGRTSPPFSRWPSASGKQRFKRTLARRRAKRPAHPPPPSRGQGPICYREDHTPRTRDQGSPHPTPALRNHHHPPPRSRATTATRATNVRARTSAGTSPTSPNPSTSPPPTPAAEPHQQHAADTTRTTGDLAPSRAGTPKSPRQERASKRAVQRQPTQHHAATGSQGQRASPARSGALPGPTNTGAVGTQPG